MKSSDGRFRFLNAEYDPLPDGSPLSEVARMEYQCRSHSTNKCSVNIGPPEGKGIDAQGHNWKLSGSADAPTISPSINCHDCWHGFIKSGVFLDTDNKPESKQ